MARNRNRHNAAFVVGAVIGGVAGAAVALWKTPYSGAELRARLTGGPSGGEGQAEAPRFSSRLLSTVENTLAPLVGVKLGQTADAEQAPAEGPITSTADQGVAAPGTATGELEPAGIGHAATTDELTTPQVETTPEALKQEEGELAPFPELGDQEPRR